MSKRVLFVVTESGKGKINEDSKSSVNANLGKEDALVFIKFPNEDSSELYYKLKDDANKIINDVANFDYVCLMPNGSTMNQNAKAIFDEAQADRDDNILETYLPMAIYQHDGRPVVMNKHIWNSMITEQPGILDLDLALKQIDSTIFGAFIPTSQFFNPDNYDPAVKHYQQYHLLSCLTDNDNLVVGIPKIVLNTINWDFMVAGAPAEEKKEHFNLARAKWKVKRHEETLLTEKIAA